MSKWLEIRDVMKEARTWVVTVAAIVASLSATQVGSHFVVPEIAHEETRKVEEGAGAASEKIVKQLNAQARWINALAEHDRKLAKKVETLQNDLLKCRKEVSEISPMVNVLVESATRNIHGRRAIERLFDEEARNYPAPTPSFDGLPTLVEITEEAPALETLPEDYKKLQRVEE